MSIFYEITNFRNGRLVKTTCLVASLFLNVYIYRYSNERYTLALDKSNSNIHDASELIRGYLVVFGVVG